MALTVTRLTSATAGSGSPVVTAAFNIASAGTLVVAAGYETSKTISSVVDSDANSFTIIKKAIAGGEVECFVAYFLNRSSGNNKTISMTFSGAIAYINYQVYLISGWSATPEVKADDSSANGTGTASAAGNADAIKTESARIAVVGNYNGEIYSNPLFGGVAAEGPYPSADYYCSWYDTWDASDPGDIDATITQAASTGWACIQVVFEKAAGAVGGTTTGRASSSTSRRRNISKRTGSGLIIL